MFIWSRVEIYSLVVILFIKSLRQGSAVTLNGYNDPSTNHLLPTLVNSSPRTSSFPTHSNKRFQTVTHIREPFQFQQIHSARKPYSRESEKAIRVTINDLRNRYVRLENMIGLLERVSYAFSRPAAIVDAIRLFALALSSVLMTTLNYS